MTAKILLVDDHALMRRGVLTLLDGEEGLRVVGEAADGREALEQVRRLSPDVVVMDVRLPGMDGNTLIRKVHELRPEVQAIVYTGSTNYKPPSDVAALGVGVENVFQKPVADMGVLADCVRRLVAERQA